MVVLRGVIRCARCTPRVAKDAAQAYSRTVQCYGRSERGWTALAEMLDEDDDEIRSVRRCFWHCLFGIVQACRCPTITIPRMSL
jgi:hypothetical protein